MRLPANASTTFEDDPANHFGLIPNVLVEKAINATDPWKPISIEDADAARNIGSTRIRLGRAR